MKMKTYFRENPGSGSKDIVSWGPKYATGVISIDRQHKDLVDLTNKLYHACLNRNEDVDTTFRDAMHRLVEYVRIHFTDEQELLKQIKFPDYINHKKEHEDLVKDILETSQSYGAGDKLAPNHCVRTLKDWIFSHIAISDKSITRYVKGQRKIGLLTDI